jgi:soluble lytic murein transglycosylase
LISVQAGIAVPAPQELSSAAMPAALGAPLSPTLHPPVPEALEAMWYVPAKEGRDVPAPLSDFARGVRMLEQTGDAASALPLVSARALADTEAAPYARFYTGVALQRLNRLDEAELAFASVASQQLAGYLPETAALRQAEVREARGDYPGAEAIYESLVQRKLAAPQSAWLRLGMMAEMNGHRDRAHYAFRYVLQTFPLTQEANEAELGLARVDGFDLSTPAAVAKELDRAATLFQARRSSPARSAYERLRNSATGDDRDLVTIRLAALDAAEGRNRAARDVLRRYVSHPRHREEAQFALLGVTRDLGDIDEYRSMARAFVSAFPQSARAEEALNELATHYVRDDEDARAAEIFRQMANQFPTGKFAERAAWRAGWWAYRQRNYNETVHFFERGAAAFPRSDYRPAWLYWSARAYDGLGRREAATNRYRLAATDYLNTYYGRLAWKRLSERNEASVTPGVRRALVPPPPAPPTADRIARLIELELYHPALAELQHAQRIYGDSAPLQATLAFVQHKIGNLRLGINAMKRAYPQYMTAGGESLPTEILQVIFPMDYWPMIQGLAREHDLDPFVVAALIGQESTFDAAIVSPANAIGLMQVMPATGRQYAKKMGIKPFSPARLTEPEINARIGARYFADLVRMFGGGTHYALASYNAGENRIARWRNEKPELEQDEFIDDIPFPETQNYVKRILGTAEDYRRLYGSGRQPSTVMRPAAVKYVAKPTTAKKAKAAPKKAVAKKSTAKKAAVKKPVTKKSSARAAKK